MRELARRARQFLEYGEVIVPGHRFEPAGHARSATRACIGCRLSLQLRKFCFAISNQQRLGALRRLQQWTEGSHVCIAELKLVIHITALNRREIVDTTDSETAFHGMMRQ